MKLAELINELLKIGGAPASITDTLLKNNPDIWIAGCYASETNNIMDITLDEKSNKISINTDLMTG